jgi:phosphoglycolate phosphatase
MAAPRSSLIFDLDGTLIDSAPDIAFALNELLAELDCAPLSLAAVRRLVGDGAPILLARALQQAGAVFEPETYESLLERYRALYLSHGGYQGLCPGARDAGTPAGAGLSGGGLHQ